MRAISIPCFRPTRGPSQDVARHDLFGRRPVSLPRRQPPPGTKPRETAEGSHFVTAGNSEAKRLSQANRGRDGAARFRRRIDCDNHPLEHDSVRRIRIETSRHFCIDSLLSRPALSASSDPRHDYLIVRSGPSFRSKACNNGHHQRSTTDRDYLPVPCFAP